MPDRSPDVSHLRLALAAAIAISLSACGPANTFQPPPPPEVEVMTIEPADITAEAGFPAVTTAPEFVEIRARVKGFLESIDFEEGGQVAKGQTLFQIEAAPFQAALDEANANRATATANMELANQNYARNYQLYQKKAISDLDLLKFKAELDRAKAEVDLAQASVEARKLDLSYTTVKAPFAGRASQRMVSVGNLVGSGENTLLTNLVQDDPMYVYFDVNEREVVAYLSDLSRDQEGRLEGTKEERVCYLEFASGGRYAHSGLLDFADNRVDPDTGTLRLRASFPNPDHQLVPGLFVRVLFPEVYKDALAVPVSAIQKDLGGDFVLVVGENDIVEQRYVEPGPLTAGKRILLSGLKPGERVITRGVQKAREGAPVRLAAPSASPAASPATS